MPGGAVLPGEVSENFEQRQQKLEEITRQISVQVKIVCRKQKAEVLRMKKQKMRFISAVLAACMMTSVLPVNALALGGGYA